MATAFALRLACAVEQIEQGGLVLERAQ